MKKESRQLFPAAAFSAIFRFAAARKESPVFG